MGSQSTPEAVLYCTTDSTSYRYTARSRAHSSMAEKRRKATNTKRKEEIDGLKEKVRKLRRELKLQADVRDLQPPSETGCPRPPLEQVLSENNGLRSAIHRQQLDNARVQSALPPPWEHHPLCT
ncbi:uncharacterized protein IUM83_06559 [Phytophthora cinnamomi]|uniref:uncharacterized protein n=1 Tax=Phytophthora cinnamomi TaxID=4785 RepID=UPI00355A0A7C|nr:hypothetical protein IUM83_06559 [Phytophthora cinnamomi]